MKLLLAIVCILPLVAPSLGAKHEPGSSRRHHNRLNNHLDAKAQKQGLNKRVDGARFTFYDAGLGSCGTYNSNSDFVSSQAFT